MGHWLPTSQTRVVFGEWHIQMISCLSCHLQASDLAIQVPSIGLPVTTRLRLPRQMLRWSKVWAPSPAMRGRWTRISRHITGTWDILMVANSVWQPGMSTYELMRYVHIYVGCRHLYITAVNVHDDYLAWTNSFTLKMNISQSQVVRIKGLF